MFRFIHCADVHLDSPLVGLEAYDGAPVEALRGSTRRALENLVRLAIDEAVSFLLIAGDLYDGDWKDFGTGLFFTRQMARLGEAGITVFLIAGNHDAASVLTRHLGLPDNVRVLSTRSPESVEVPGLPTVVHGRGFPNRAVDENLVPDYPDATPGRFNIGLLHTSLTGAPGHDSYAPCSVRDLAEKGYDYWALGHVHKPQVLSRDPWVVFPGNLQGRHIREAGPRGCQLVTVSDSREVVAAEHVPLDVVRWQLVEVDVSGAVDMEDVFSRVGDALRQALVDCDGRLMAARVVVCGSTALHGRLKRDAEHLRAECISQALAAGGEHAWIEEAVVATSAAWDVDELAERDELAGIVMTTLDEAGTGTIAVPAEIEDMLKALPAEIAVDVRSDLSEDKRHALLEDVRAIVLDALTRRGGET